MVGHVPKHSNGSVPCVCTCLCSVDIVIVDVIIANKDRVRAVSFGRGPDAKMIGRFRDAGILCIPTVGAVKHAEKMVQLGCEMITVQGGEGGGHTGLVGTLPLLAQAVEAVKIPVVGAGGLYDGRGLAACLALGAQGVWMGTRFIASHEAHAGQKYKDAIVGMSESDTVISKVFTGKTLRAIVNDSNRDFDNRTAKPVSSTNCNRIKLRISSSPPPT